MKIDPKICPVLLIADDPGGQHAGSVFLETLGSAFPPEALIRVSMTGRGGAGEQTRRWLGHSHRKMALPFNDIPWCLRAFKRQCLPVLHVLLRLVRVPRAVKDVEFLIAQKKVKAIWAVLGSPATIYVAQLVASRTGLPLIGLVWDPPERWILEGQVDRFNGIRMLSAFDWCIRHCKSLGVASEGMQAGYQKRYGMHSEVLIHGVSTDLQMTPPRAVNEGDWFTIAFAGSLYASQEWEAFVAALDATDWQIAGKRIRVRTLGSAIRMTSKRGVQVEYCGWRPVPEVIRIISESDVSYLPYFISPRWRQIVDECFPNKLSVYVAAGKPVFFHGPEDCSPARFLKRYPAGVCCGSLEKSDILNKLRILAEDSDLYEQSCLMANRAFLDELNETVFLKRFERLLSDVT